MALLKRQIQRLKTITCALGVGCKKRREMKDPKTRNSYKSCVNRSMTEAQILLKIKLEREGKLTWREIDEAINKVGRDD